MIENLDSLALRYRDGSLLVLDQRVLPGTESWTLCNSPEEMCHIIKTLQVRGAPLIGLAAALALADYAQSGATEDEILAAAHKLYASRPTAVNLKFALDDLVFTNPHRDRATIARKAEALFKEDIQLCARMSAHAAPLIRDGDNILTHCNTGSLVTAGIGTALGAIKQAWRDGKKIHVYVDETRPLLQGARLTTWELEREGIPHTLICDNMAATLMHQGRIASVFLGSDRIAMNGDAANKIGTYSVAVLANYHRIPFYVVAPYTTVDLNCPSGTKIPIEQRNPEEVTGFASVADGEATIQWAPRQTEVFNPAFDVTPAALITAIILDKGIFTGETLKREGLQALASDQ